MKKGGRLASVSGFTIVETLIVLAVSSMLFVIAATMITGRQAKTEFQVASRDVQTKIQQVINEAKSGYYGAETTSDCMSNATAPPGPGLSFPAGASAIGTRGQCIFIGKAFVASGSTLYIYPLAGLRQVNGADVTSAKEARATVIPNASETYTLPYGTTFVGYSVNNTAGPFVGGARGFSILTSFSSAETLGGQTFGLHYFNGALGGNETTFKNNINNEMNKNALNADPSDPSAPFPTASSITLCIQSGGTDQSLKLIIGGDDSTTVRTEVKGNTTCAG